MRPDQGHPSYDYSKARRLQKNIVLQGFFLKPRAFVLAWTREVIDLPVTSRIAARVEGKSSLARIGMGVHVTAPTIHSGFKGPIQLEIYNFGENEIILDPIPRPDSNKSGNAPQTPPKKAGLEKGRPPALAARGVPLPRPPRRLCRPG